MTYPLMIVPFAVVTILVTLLSAIRPNFGQRMLASALAALFVCVLTAIFDNLMIASDLVVYPAEHLSGIFIGLAPVEDFSYSICAAFLVPAVFVLLRRSPVERTPE